MTDTHVLEFWSSRKNNADPFTFVGDFQRLFYNPVTKSIRVSDGETPGGFPISGGGSGSAEALYTTVTPPATTNGLLWFNPNTDSLYVASNGVWIEVGSSGSEGAVTLYTNVQPPASVNGLLWYNPDSSELFIVRNSTWVKISGASRIEDLSDVTIVDPQVGDALVYEDGTFQNVPLNLRGGSNNQILVKKSADDYDYAWEDMIINVTDNAYTKLLDQVSSELLYVGEAVPESLESAAVWRIQRIIFDNLGNVEEIRYADGGLFDQIWNNRTILTYV